MKFNRTVKIEVRDARIASCAHVFLLREADGKLELIVVKPIHLQAVRLSIGISGPRQRDLANRISREGAKLAKVSVVG